VKKIGGRSIRLWDTGGWTPKFWGVSITPNLLFRGETNRQYFLSPENVKRICIKHFINDGAIRPHFGVSRGSNFWIFWWKFVTLFISIFDKLPTNRFSYKFVHRRALTSSFYFWNNISDLTTRFWDKGDEKFWDPTISPNVPSRAPKFFSSLETPEYPMWAKFRGHIPNSGSQGARQIFQFLRIVPNLAKDVGKWAIGI